jgi:hypothetical protein
VIQVSRYPLTQSRPYIEGDKTLFTHELKPLRLSDSHRNARREKKLSSQRRNWNIWWTLLSGALGLIDIFSMSVSAVAELRHILAALTVLIALTMFDILLRSLWPVALALILLAVIKTMLT